MEKIVIGTISLGILTAILFCIFMAITSISKAEKENIQNKRTILYAVAVASLFLILIYAGISGFPSPN